MEEQNLEPTSPAQDTPGLSSILVAQWNEAKSWAEAAHATAREDRAFYDGDQWSNQQRHELKAAGRPDTVINQIAKAIDNLIGRERSARFDWKVLPRGASDVPVADGMTKALAYVGDQAKARFVISEAFEDAVKGPMGWLEIAYEDQDPTREPLVLRRVDPFEMFPDPHSKDVGLDDARFLIRVRWVDLDVALRSYPEHAEKLKAKVQMQGLGEQREEILGDYDNRDDGQVHYGKTDSLDWLDDKRKRVCLREHWWYVEEDALFLVTPDDVVVDYDPADPQLPMYIAAGAQLREGRKRIYKYAVMAGSEILFEGDSPYPFDRYPYVPLWAKRDRFGRPHGYISIMKDAQKELNVARSRLNESIRSRWAILKKGKFTPAEVREIERKLAKANFVLEATDPENITIGNDKADVMAWLNLMETSRREIEDAIGLTEASFGEKSNEKSGRAVELRSQSAALAQGKVFDMLGFARQCVGEMLLALCQKFYTPQKLARIVEASVIRAGVPTDLSWLGQVVAGPIRQMRFDVVIEDQAELATERQAEMQQKIELLGYVPDLMKLMFLPDLIRGSDWKNAEEWAARLDQAFAQQQMMAQQQAMMQAQAQAPPQAPPEVA